MTTLPNSPVSRPSNEPSRVSGSATILGTPCVTNTRSSNQTRVKFLEDDARSGVVVACETSHPGGVIAPLVRGLTDLKLEVHQIESKLTDGVRSERLWVSAADGEPLSQRRHGLLRTAVFEALESASQASVSQATTAPRTELSV